MSSAPLAQETRGPASDIASSHSGHDAEKHAESPLEQGISDSNNEKPTTTAQAEPAKPPGGPPGMPGGPPPNGGTTAWLQVLGGFFLFFNTWGKKSA
jgi:hypothetical protein